MSPGGGFLSSQTPSTVAVPQTEELLVDHHSSAGKDFTQLFASDQDVNICVIRSELFHYNFMSNSGIRPSLV